MNSVKDSCDLSRQFGGKRLDVEVVGIGVNHTNFEGLAPLWRHVQIILIFKGMNVEVKDPTNAPWRIISFDSEAGKLVVELVDDS